MSPKQTHSGGKLSTDQLSIVVRKWLPPIAATITIDDPRWHGYTFALILDAGQVASFEIQLEPDAKPLNAWRLQHVPFGLLERALRAKVNSVVEQWESDNPAAPALFSPEDWPDPSERTRANRDDVQLAKLARRYVETLGESKQVDGLAEAFGYSRSSIAKLIRRARDRHLLTATSKGRPGGQLTPKALALLGEVPAKPTPARKLTTRERIELATTGVQRMTKRERTDLARRTRRQQ